MILKHVGPFSVLELDTIDGVLHAHIVGTSRVDINVAMELVKARRDITKGEECYLLVDFSQVRQVTAEAKTYLLRPEEGLQSVLGTAFIANNPVSALIANIFIKSPKNFPSRYFSRKDEAAQWLRSLNMRTLKKA